MNSVKFCSVEGVDSVLEVLAGSCLQCLRGVAFLEGAYRGACNVLEGRGILGAGFGGAWHFGGGACSCFWRGVAFLEGAAWRSMAFWRRCLQCFGGAWHFGGCLQCFGGAWHFGVATCSVLEGSGILEEALAVVLEGCGILERCLQCFGGAWHFEEAGVWHFGVSACSCCGGVWHFGGHCLEGGILEEALAVFWTGGDACSILEGRGIFVGRL